ncbi:hypothetical protein L914_14658 [Phytophthora nicotianae]|uniref:Uncharacterized protein n=1 Tax=Phytophthora nicotianae TaxID=4792 RepID=W2MS06_PHYNI|nr:hypothetical protein L914_14658 [Phytophthora nicotianae]
MRQRCHAALLAKATALPRSIWFQQLGLRIAGPLLALSVFLVSSRIASSTTDEEFNSSSGLIKTTSAKPPAFKASQNSATDISSISIRAFTADRESRLMSPSTFPVTLFTSVYSCSQQSRGVSLLVTMDTSSDAKDVTDVLCLLLLSLRDRARPDEGGAVTYPPPPPGAATPTFLDEETVSRETLGSEPCGP